MALLNKMLYIWVMEIEEENKAKTFYIESDINGIHIPTRNVVELNQLDLYKLMHTYADTQIKEYIRLRDCKHKNIISEDGLDECMDCGVRNY